MLRLIALRTVSAFLILLAASAIVFFGTEALPGDAATAILGQDATPARVEQFRAESGLDRPAVVRYAEWMTGFVTGNLGASLISGAPISDILVTKARNTVALTAMTLVMLVPLSIILAVAAAMRRDRPLDLGISATTLVLIAIPEFAVGAVVAVVFGVWLGLIAPVSLVDSSRPIFAQLDLLILPAVTLLCAALAQTTRMIRACVIDVLGAPYIQMAELKGVRRWRIMLRHALPNALGPTIQVLVFNVAWLAGGVVVVETVFQYPGLGTELVKSVSTRDLPLVTTIGMLITGAYVVTNLVGELAGLLLNPRVRRRIAMP